MGMAGRFDAIRFEADITDNAPMVKKGLFQTLRKAPVLVSIL
jgi:hypothetical protein